MSAPVVTIFPVISLEPVQPEKKLGWRCAGCEETHLIPVTGARRWEWNESLDRPTLAPSVLVRFSRGDAAVVCHSFVRNGVVEFLGDCTHALAGQSVAMRPEDADPFGVTP